MKPRVLILVDFLAVAAFLQITGIGVVGSDTYMAAGYGKPFTVASRHWTCSSEDLGEEMEYGMSFYTNGLLINAAIIGALALAAYFLWRKIQPSGPVWSRIACRAYALAAISLLTINVWFAVAHRADTQTMQSGPQCAGWPVTTWLVYSSSTPPRFIGIFRDSDTYNGLIAFTVPLLLALVCETIVRRQRKRHNKRMHQTPDGAGDP
jgi:hypothetical protein